MTRAEKEEFIRRCARESSSRAAALLWSTHAVQRLIAHALTRTQVEVALTTGSVIEDYPDGHRALPDCLVLGLDAGGEPVHAVMAVDAIRDRALLVTVYRPSATRWADDWKTRR